MTLELVRDFSQKPLLAASSRLLGVPPQGLGDLDLESMNYPQILSFLLRCDPIRSRVELHWGTLFFVVKKP